MFLLWFSVFFRKQPDFFVVEILGSKMLKVPLFMKRLPPLTNTFIQPKVSNLPWFQSWGEVAQEWHYCQQISVINGFSCTLGNKHHNNKCFMHDYNKPNCENSVWKICRWLTVRSGKLIMAFQELHWFLIIQPRFLKSEEKELRFWEPSGGTDAPPLTLGSGPDWPAQSSQRPDASNAPVGNRAPAPPP